MTRMCTSPAFSLPTSDDEDEEALSLDSLLQNQAKLTVRIRQQYSTKKPDVHAKYFTYVLMLQDGYIYVGNSDNIYTRLMEHFLQSPQSSVWVREHGPIKRVVEIIRNSAADDETYKMLEYCELLGWEKVRGAQHCKLDLRNPPPNLLTFQRDTSRQFDYMCRTDIDAVVRIARKLGSQLNQLST